LTLRIVVPLALACGVLAALASNVRGAVRMPRAARPASVVYAAPAPAYAVRAPLALLRPFAYPVYACPPTRAGAAAAPSGKLSQSFGILRRERTAADVLSAEALRALKQRGVVVADPSAARLLRGALDGSRAWVVPVADVSPLLSAISCRRVPSTFAVPARPPVTTPATPSLTTPVPQVVAPTATPRRSRATARAWARARRRSLVRAWPLATAMPPVAVAPFVPVPLARLDGKPQEGLVVVATGDVPAGGGGSLSQLLRGQAPPAVAPCAGPKHVLVGVSGIVPDDVSAVYLTAADGSAVRADVQDNGYAFLVAPAAGRERGYPRYVVWTGKDGTPHVQPVFLPSVPARLCSVIAHRTRGAVVLTPSAQPLMSALGAGLTEPYVVRPPTVRVPSVPRPRRPKRP
jgi:hypothetical protein